MWDSITTVNLENINKFEKGQKEKTKANSVTSDSLSKTKETFEEKVVYVKSIETSLRAEADLYKTKCSQLDEELKAEKEKKGALMAGLKKEETHFKHLKAKNDAERLHREKQRREVCCQYYQLRRQVTALQRRNQDLTRSLKEGAELTLATGALVQRKQLRTKRLPDVVQRAEDGNLKLLEGMRRFGDFFREHVDLVSSERFREPLSSRSSQFLQLRRSNARLMEENQLLKQRRRLESSCTSSSTLETRRSWRPVRGSRVQSSSVTDPVPPSVTEQSSNDDNTSAPEVTQTREASPITYDDLIHPRPPDIWWEEVLAKLTDDDCCYPKLTKSASEPDITLLAARISGNRSSVIEENHMLKQKRRLGNLSASAPTLGINGPGMQSVAATELASFTATQQDGSGDFKTIAKATTSQELQKTDDDAEPLKTSNLRRDANVAFAMGDDDYVHVMEKCFSAPDVLQSGVQSKNVSTNT